VRVDGDRLWRHLMAMAEIGATAAGGSNRQALSDDDVAGRALFSEWARAAGCVVSVDRIGNVFARRAGRDEHAAPVRSGSHLDTQPTGGRFDGVYGVLGALEVVETLHDHGIETDRPIEVVVWTNEEGSRFQHSMLGSAVWSGLVPLESALQVTDGDGVTIASELERHGLGGVAPALHTPTAAYVELHIEQGPILERDGCDIGAVTGAQGLRWFELTFTGRAAHAGPTPMDARADPVRALAATVDTVYRATAAAGEWARATFAQVHSQPASPNTVPDRLTCTLDLRHPHANVLDELEAALHRALDAATAETGVEHDVVRLSSTPPVTFDAALVQSVREAAEAHGWRHVDIVSGAGHDACHVATVAPTAMIFVPCAGGVSHNEAESITPVQAERGASVLLDVLVRAASA
jgi:beta-ureidopropionase / N-carbamoyl-L-amino-acid hydrolase